jgi:putative transcriptional regulator
LGGFLKTNIREFRQLKGFTQQDLADAVGVTRQTINALENAKYNPSLVLAYKITKVLDQEHIEDVFVIYWKK